MEKTRNEKANQIYAEHAENRGMTSIADLMPKAPVKKKTNGGVNSQFNDAVAKAIGAVLGKDKPFGYWCGRLRNVSPSKIFEFISNSKDAKKPVALFQYLLKQYRAEQKLSTCTPTLAVDTKK